MATLYKIDGTTKEVLPRDQKRFKIEELQKLVGGYVEQWKLHNSLRIVMDEDAKLKGRPINTEASRFFSVQAGAAVVVAGDAVVGTRQELGLG